MHSYTLLDTLKDAGTATKVYMKHVISNVLPSPPPPPPPAAESFLLVMHKSIYKIVLPLFFLCAVFMLVALVLTTAVQEHNNARLNSTSNDLDKKHKRHTASTRNNINRPASPAKMRIRARDMASQMRNGELIEPLRQRARKVRF